MTVVVHLNRRIDAKFDRLFNHGTVLACDAQGHILTRHDIIGQPERIGDLCAQCGGPMCAGSLRILDRFHIVKSSTRPLTKSAGEESRAEDFQHFWTYCSPTWSGRFVDGWCKSVMRSRLEPLKKVARTLRANRSLASALRPLNRCCPA